MVNHQHNYGKSPCEIWVNHLMSPYVSTESPIPNAIANGSLSLGISGKDIHGLNEILMGFPISMVNNG